MNKQKIDFFFNRLNELLKNGERSIPRAIIDLDALNQNIATLKETLSIKADLRVVVKSLPSAGLIHHIMNQAGTRKLMVFHQPFLSDIAKWGDPSIDILLGKPMPVKSAGYFYKTIKDQSGDFDPFNQVQWLVDTEARLMEYLQLAIELKQVLRINLEIDVGLHRGGFTNLSELRKVLQIIRENSESIVFSGFMGYDPHIVKLPAILRSEKKSLQMANDCYSSCISLLQDEFNELVTEDLTFNGAGSPTVGLHTDDNSMLNDISVGSALVKPTTFDILTLEKFKPACYIATPVLKKFEGTTIPGLEWAKGLLSLINKSHKSSYFIYGGFWKADYCYPTGLRANSLYGPSTNQSMVNLPKSEILNVDDFVFLRPHQSEFVLLQFGKLLILQDDALVDEWELLSQD